METPEWDLISTFDVYFLKMCKSSCQQDYLTYSERKKLKVGVMKKVSERKIRE